MNRAARSTVAVLPTSSSPVLAASGNAALVVTASLFVALCAHASVPLPFTPVPVVLSDFAVILVGLLLGPTMGSAALALYLAEGAAGLPVFSPFGAGGIVQLLGPTAGYLLAYPLAAASAGWLRQVLAPRIGTPIASLLAASMATGLLLGSGAVWLAHLHHLSSHLTWALAVLPFLAGAAAKVVAASAIATSARALRRA